MDTNVKRIRSIQADPHPLPLWYTWIDQHNGRVQTLALRIATQAQIDPVVRKTIAWAARWHDLGKLDLSPAILMKRGSLTRSEYAQIRRHPQLGALRAQREGAPAAVITAILAHHERWDGRGYGIGLVGKQIPLAAQVIALADTIDALRSERPYKAALSLDEIGERLASEREHAFRPDLLDLTLDLIRTQLLQ